MRQMKSTISSTAHAQVRAVGQLSRQANRQTVTQARPEVGVIASPGEVDHRKFEEPALQDYVLVHRKQGQAVTATLALDNNPKQWRDYSPGHGEGLFIPPGFEFDSKPYYYTDPDQNGAAPDELVITEPDFDSPDYVAPPPGRLVTFQRSVAGPVSTNVLQDKNNWK